MTSNTLRVSEALVHAINDEEFDFSDLFLCDGFASDTDQGPHLHDDDRPPELAPLQSSADVHHTDPPSASGHSPSPPTAGPARPYGAGAGFHSSLGQPSSLGNIPAPSPRIEITPSADSLGSQPSRRSPSSKALGPYRDQPCVSPASSNSSSGWPAEACSPSASPSVSPAAGLSALDLCPGIQGIAGIFSPHCSPGASPCASLTEESFLAPRHHRATSPLPHQRSRSASPQGKRPYDQGQGGRPCAESCTPVKQRSRSPSPIPITASASASPSASASAADHDPCGSYQHQHQQQPPPQSVSGCSPGLPEDTLGSLIPPGVPKAGAQEYKYADGWGWNPEQDGRKDRAGAGAAPLEAIYVLPHIWPPYISAGHKVYSGLPVASVPPLDWPLPSQAGPYELVIHQQPKSHHRAHYETEGSRGAVKTPTGGHPVVQLVGGRGAGPLALQVFIGMADERVLKPHAFYQVHRITGKTVTTASLERLVKGTKVLEIALEPKNNMTALIDCAGILKLRNADIEQRNSETDIGRKNTRVRLVFRVHIPQTTGGFLSLQVASQPIECSQRSAQELPAVERQDLDECSVLGGLQMVLTGQNFTYDSKVVFSERRQDGQQVWEVEAIVDRDKTHPAMLFVSVPPYRDPTISHVAKVNFFVVNGKKKRSQPQHFVYTPLKAIKPEPFDNYHTYGCADAPGVDPPPRSRHHHGSMPNANNLRPLSYHVTNHDLGPAHESPAFYNEEEELRFYSSRTNTVKNIAPIQPYHDLHQLQPHATGGFFPVQRPSVGQHQHLRAGLGLTHVPAYHPSNSAHSFDHGAAVGNTLQRGGATPPEPEVSDPLAAPRHHSYAHIVGLLGMSPPTLSSPCAQRRDADKMCGSRAEGPPLPAQRGAALPDRPWSDAERAREGKQDHHGQFYLEDVHDIIKRDMGARGGAAS